MIDKQVMKYMEDIKISIRDLGLIVLEHTRERKKRERHIAAVMDMIYRIDTFIAAETKLLDNINIKDEDFRSNLVFMVTSLCVFECDVVMSRKFKRKHIKTLDKLLSKNELADKIILDAGRFMKGEIPYEKAVCKKI